MSQRRLPGEWKGLPPHEVPCGRCGHRPCMHTVYASGNACPCWQWLHKESVWERHQTHGPSVKEDWCDCPGYVHPSQYPIPCYPMTANRD